MSGSQRKQTLRVAVFATTPPNIYSGGRYHALMMAEALAAAGHDTCFVTDHQPVFYSDFVEFAGHQKLRMVLTPDFRQGLPEGDFDVAVLVPGTNVASFYLRTRAFALQRRAHLALLNFESENWFNSLSPTKRDPGQWTQWELASREASLIISSARESRRFAEEYYRRLPMGGRHACVYPAINTAAADSVARGEPEKRILMIARFEQARHKGSWELPKLINETIRGYTLAIIVGTGGIPMELMEELIDRANGNEVKLEIRYAVSDLEKFKEIKRASLLLFPSLFEGFGYPPVEALYCGTPCVAFELPVLRETCGDKLVYARHGDWDHFREQVAVALRQPIDHAELNRQVAPIASLEAMAGQLDDALLPLQHAPLPFGAARPLRLGLLKCRLFFRHLGLRATTRDCLRRAGRAAGRPFLYLMARYRSAGSPAGQISYYPVFSNKEALTNHYYRAAWYLPRTDKHCLQVLLHQNYSRSDRDPGPLPKPMGKPHNAPDHIRIQHGRVDCLLAALRSQVVLVWDGYHRSWACKLFKMLGIQVVNVDTDDLTAHEYGAYCGLLWRHLVPEKEKQFFIHQSRRRFEQAAQEIAGAGYHRAAVFGTGPSLEDAELFDFSNTLTIVCNTVVQNESLMNHLRPRFICAGDAISHFGVSLYAQQWRKDLIRQLRERDDLYYFGTATFGYTFLANHPEIRERTILIEQKSDEPNYNLRAHFSAPKLDSTLNIHMLPLAATFQREIWMLGCDGKSTRRSNEDFWAHAKGAHYHDLVDTGHQCHPTFDVHRQKSTHQRFIRSVETTVEGGERLGIFYGHLRPSNTAPLTPRSLAEDWFETRGFTPPYRFEDFGDMARGEIHEAVPIGETDICGGAAPVGLDQNLPTLAAVGHCTLDHENYLIVKGWAISPRPIDRVQILLGDRELGDAEYRIRRPDILQKYPAYQNGDAGFQFIERLDSPHGENLPIKLQIYSENELLLALECAPPRRIGAHA